MTYKSAMCAASQTPAGAGGLPKHVGSAVMPVNEGSSILRDRDPNDSSSTPVILLSDYEKKKRATALLPGCESRGTAMTTQV